MTSSGIRSARRLEYFTIAWNVLEAVVSIGAGIIAGSTALVGFGIDSAIESSSALALLWRLQEGGGDEAREHSTLRLVGVTFVLLAIYVSYESVHTLLTRDAPEVSVPGIVIASASLIVMPLLSRAKLRLALEIGSPALRADSRQTLICAYLSAILLAGLLLNATPGWWWADPFAALLMVPVILHEGIDALRGGD